jgi:TfoX/Sxy family transcriptional regulator of competence genes
MTSRRDVADFLLDQLARVGDVRAKRMFGEFGFYVGDRFVAVVCDDRLFLKATDAGRANQPDLEEGTPFPGARAWLVVPGELWEDADWLCGIFVVTAGALPPVKAGKKAAAIRPGSSR